MERYKNTALSASVRAKDLLDKLSLDEKLGQIVGMFATPGDDAAYAEMFKNGVGQISTLSFCMCDSPEAAAGWQYQMQNSIIKNSPHHIPAIFHMEGICGSFLKGSTSFPSGVNRGASFDVELERQIGQIVSRQEAACGISQVLAPVLDVARDPRMGRHSEPYGEDPTLAAAMGSAFTEGIQETETDGRHPEAVAKHFLGFHTSMGGIHGACVEVGERTLRELHGKPFQAAIAKAKLRGIMPSYCSVNGMPIHASRKYLTDLLRGEMKFDGITVSDYGAVWNVNSMHNVGEDLADSARRCLEAGMDMELPVPVCYGQNLKALVESGQLSMECLDQAVLRILEAKFRMGLFEHPYALLGEALQEILHQEEDDAVSRKAAQESITLLKNDGILPLNRDNINTIAVIGPHAKNARYYFGGYTHLSMVESMKAAGNSMAGVGEGGDSSALEMKRVPGTNVQDDEEEKFDEILRSLEPECQSLLQALTNAFPQAQIRYAEGYPKAGSDESGFGAALALVEQADLAILTLGGKNGSGSIATMGEGVDGTDINLPLCQRNFIRKAASLGKPLVGVHFDGRPISSDEADTGLDAIVEAWTPARYAAEAVTNVLTGSYNPSGKLPVTVARNAGQLPINYNHPNGSSWHQGMSVGFSDYVDMPHKPRYCFGHGLSYTDFTYSDLTLSADEIGPDEMLTVSFDLENSGTVAGTEIVQLYLIDKQASMTRPVKELQGFARVELAAGEKKKISFAVDPSLAAFLDEDMRWKIEKGEILVQIGASSEDIRLQGGFRIRDNRWVESHMRSFWANVLI